MRIIHGSRRHHYVARVSSFLIMVALLTGIEGCNGGGGESYTITISSTTGGSVTTPGEGAFTYDAGTVVQLAATPDDGYEFYVWTGDIQDIADPSSASTTITMNGDYSITADFGGGGAPSPSKP
jgi:hypothetical protein